MNMTNKKGKDKPLGEKELALIKRQLNKEFEIPPQILNQLKEICGDGFILISSCEGTPVVNSWFGSDLAAVGLITHGLRFFSSMHNYHDNTFLRGLSQQSDDDEMLSD
jgi:hypothetical protein